MNLLIDFFGRTSTLSSVRVSDEPIQTQIISNAWGKYPQLEMFSVPRRSNTHPGHGLRRPERKSEDLNARAQARIAKRLADVSLSFFPFNL